MIARGVAVLVASSAAGALAQEKQKYSFKVPAGAAKYTQQHVIDVGDVPGHQIRVYELHYSYTREAPAYDGVKVVESWTRATSDYTDGTGHATGYGVAQLQNGDRIFSRLNIVTQTTMNPDGSKKTTFSTVATLTGGTGRFRGIHGTLKTIGNTDFKSISASQTDGEYWIEK
jgi:hypothetical protein